MIFAFFYMMLSTLSLFFFSFFFFKQKTAYEMRISDWSSDVCSSDLAVPVVLDRDPAAICQHKGRDIDSIAMRMFGQVSGHIAVHFSAGIGAIGFNAYQLAAQDQARGWLGAVAGPCRKS